MTLQERMRVLMEEQGLNQKQLSLRASITEASLSKYLSGERKPRTDVVVKIAKALNTSVNYLLDDEPTPEKPFDYASTALARCKGHLSEEDKKKLIKFLLED